MKKKLKYIIPVLILLAVAALVLYRNYSNRTIWNNSYVNGNTAGNLYNHGLFCEHNGVVYFSNPNDNHYLYSMPSGGGKAVKLYEDIVSYINADDNYVYYVRNNLSGDGSEFSYFHLDTNSLCRYDLKKKTVTVLDHDPSIYASLIGNSIYYTHYDDADASTLYRVKIDGSDREQVDKHPYFTCSANGQYFYYNGLENDHNIYQMDTSTKSSHLIYEGNCWMPSADNENIYFMDCDRNYALARLDLSASQPVILVSDRIDAYNVFGDVIFFQKNDADGNAALCRINTDGSGYREIASGSYTNINVTSQYVYFSQYGNEKVIYQMPLSGDGDISVFQP